MKLPDRSCVDTSARAQWPEHPFIHAQDKFARNSEPRRWLRWACREEGNIFTPDTLKRLHEITRRLDGVATTRTTTNAKRCATS
jgi:hypothetical protein